MTAQTGEYLSYRGELYVMATEPLNAYLRERKINFESPSSDNWRGYTGEWEIREDKLYLVNLTAYIKDYEKVGLDYLFPGQEKVLASWFTGEIRVPAGEILEYVHMGYDSMYETDYFFDFQEGVLVEVRQVDNKGGE